MRAALLALLAACSSPAPCDDITGACIELRVTSATVDRIDQLELDILYDGRHATTTTSPGGGTTGLPLLTAIEVEGDVGLVAAGKLAGSVLGTGAATAVVAPGAHVELTIELAPVAACEAGGYYCGGDKLAGDPSTLYTCNGGGVPLARGKCAGVCEIRPPQDDLCAATGGQCSVGGFYCGGDKLAGDPQSLYRCAADHTGIDRVVCPAGCVIAPAGSDDHCR